MFSIAPHFYPICFGKFCPPFTYIGGSKGRPNSILQNRTFYFGEPKYFFFFLSRGLNKLAHCKKKKKMNLEAHHLINRRGEWIYHGFSQRLQYIYSRTVQSLIKCFCDMLIKDAHHKRKKKLNFGGPHN